ncbi:efflux RND transporter periplasmic adaptor subunit [Pendulispora brunnea]|uniref:Efflux RND transporter periplasmic adaptor subunit n=1 Tax=Pendulispora brunnea TaxID=2905690 RepID=A0ABZ2KQ20_9BACT
MNGARMRAWRWIVGLLVIGAVAFGYVKYQAKKKGAAAAGGGPPEAAASASAAANRPVPVVLANVESKDMPIYLYGLGTATAFYTVTVKSQVDGRLQQVLFKEGQAVKKGDVLAQVDPRPFTIALHQAEAALARDTATAKNAKLNLERYQTLVGQKLISQQQFTDQQAAADTADATLRADQAAIENARLQLEYSRITSPIDGITGVRNVDPGNLVQANGTDGIVIITQLDPIAVFFTLPQDDLPRVSEAMSHGPLTVDAFSRDGDQLLGSGTVMLIDNQINTATATIRLKASFPNPDKKLWPNLFVKARLLLTNRRGAIVVPTPVVQRGPQGAFAYVAKPDQTAEMRPIEVDLTQGDWTIISKGLNAGEHVVQDGQFQLRPGSKLAPRAADKPTATRQGESKPAPSSSAVAAP